MQKHPRCSLETAAPSSREATARARAPRPNRRWKIRCTPRLCRATVSMDPVWSLAISLLPPTAHRAGLAARSLALPPPSQAAPNVAGGRGRRRTTAAGRAHPRSRRRTPTAGGATPAAGGAPQQPAELPRSWRRSPSRPAELHRTRTTALGRAADGELACAAAWSGRWHSPCRPGSTPIHARRLATSQFVARELDSMVQAFDSTATDVDWSVKILALFVH